MVLGARTGAKTGLPFFDWRSTGVQNASLNCNVVQVSNWCPAGRGKPKGRGPMRTVMQVPVLALFRPPAAAVHSTPAALRLGPAASPAQRACSDRLKPAALSSGRMVPPPYPPAGEEEVRLQAAGERRAPINAARGDAGRRALWQGPGLSHNAASPVG